MSDRHSPTVVVSVFSALIAWVVWNYGGVTNSAPVVILSVLTASLCYIVVVRYRELSSRVAQHPTSLQWGAIPWPTLLTLAAVGLGACQLVGWPEEVLRWIAPGSAEVYQEFLPRSVIEEWATDTGSGLVRLRESGHYAAPISVAPYRTRLAMNACLVFGMSCLVATNLPWNLRRVQLFLCSLTILGVLVAILGSADHLVLSRDWQPELRARLWVAPVGADSPFGTFVNSNNAAGFLQVCMGAAIGLGFSIRSRQQMHRRFAMSCLCYGAILILALGIMATESRASFLALGVSVCSWAAGNRQNLRWRQVAAFSAVAIVLGVSFLHVLGTDERVMDRMFSMIDGRALENPRVEHWRDSLRAGMHFLPFGAGLGSYRYAYLPFQLEGSNRWFVNADGMPVEWFVEGGLVVLGIVLLGLALTVRELRRAVQLASSDDSDEDNICCRTVIQTFLYVIPALLVSQAFDFGITLPALYLPVSVLLGILVGLGLRNKTLKVVPCAQKIRARWITQAVVVVFMLVGGIKGVVDHNRDAWLQSVDQAVSVDRRKPVEQWKGFLEEESQLRQLAEKQQNNSEVYRVLSNVIVSNQQLHGYSAFANGNVLNREIAGEVKPEWLSLATLRSAIKSTEMGRVVVRRGPDFMLPGQDFEQFIAARNYALRSLILSPLDDRPRIRLIETDFAAQDRNVSQLLTNHVRRLRAGDVAIEAYVDRLERMGQRAQPASQYDQ